MASLTIRKLDDAIRDELRLRAARNGRSVEDEVRVILRDAVAESLLARSNRLSSRRAGAHDAAAPRRCHSPGRASP